MKEEDIRFLKCIDCGNDLIIISFLSEENELREGKILCEKCMKEWPIINGIPRILPTILLEKLVYSKYKDFFLKYESEFNLKNSSMDDIFEQEKVKTAISFGFEWLKYENIIKQFENDWNRHFAPFMAPQDFKNKVVVDCGCGLGKHGYFTAKYGAKYIGIDLSEAVEATYRNIRNFNPLIIQADLHNLPLKSSFIDIFYSIGVIHHLPDPRVGFLKIVELMKKNCKIFIWVYGTYKNRRAKYIYNPLRKITIKMSKNLLYYLCYIPAILTHSLNLISKGLEKINLNKMAQKVPFYYYSKFPFKFKVNDSFDVLATPTQEYYDKEEISEWFIQANFKDFKVKYDEYQGIKGFAIK